MNAVDHNRERGHAFHYMPALDGLRALAVIAVVLYHADCSWMPGGFLGVEVFFVISGFLITALLRGEHGARGRIGLVDFWWRRARRLLPAVWVLIAAVLIAARIGLPHELPSLRQDAAAGAGYFTNWWLIFEQRSYFEQSGRPSLLRHLWSLAIEEQFYLLWPLLFAGLLSRLRPALAGLVLVSLSALGAWWMAALFNPDFDPSRVYYGSDTRAPGLLIGAALAFLVTPGRSPGGRVRARILAAFAGVSLVALALLCVGMGEYDVRLYRGGMLSISMLSALVVAAAARPDTGLFGRVLGAPLLSALGRRSYSLYLWHWPVFMLTRPQLDLPLSGPGLLLARVALSMLLAELSFRFVETPVRDGSLVRALRQLLARARACSRRARTVLALSTCAAGASLVLLFAALIRFEPLAPASAYASNAAAPAIEDDPIAPPTARPVSPPAWCGSESAAPASYPLEANEGAAPACSALRPPQDHQDYQDAPRRVASPKPADWALRHRRPHRVLAIGDSVMLGAARRLHERAIQVRVDAEPGRQVSESLDLMLDWAQRGALAPVVVVHLGNNGTFRDYQFERMMRLLARARTVVFLNTRVPRRWQDDNNRVLVEGVKRHPRAVLVDWKAYSEDRPEWFAGDGYHLRADGARAYAELVRTYFYYASDAERARIGTKRADRPATQRLEAPADRAQARTRGLGPAGGAGAFAQAVRAAFSPRRL